MTCSSCHTDVQVTLVVTGRPAPFRGRVLPGATDGESHVCIRCWRTPVVVAAETKPVKKRRAPVRGQLL